MATIRAVMQKELITVRPTTPTADAIRLLIANEISGLPVVDGDGHLVGVLSEKDLLKVFYEESGRTESVGALMTSDPMALDVNAPLVDVVDCLMTNDFRRVLITDGPKLVGLVSRADLMPTILEALLDRTGSQSFMSSVR